MKTSTIHIHKCTGPRSDFNKTERLNNNSMLKVTYLPQKTWLNFVSVFMINYTTFQGNNINLLSPLTF